MLHLIGNQVARVGQVKAPIIIHDVVLVDIVIITGMLPAVVRDVHEPVTVRR